jgi:hypothetical protein
MSTGGEGAAGFDSRQVQQMCFTVARRFLKLKWYLKFHEISEAGPSVVQLQ